MIRSGRAGHSMDSRCCSRCLWHRGAGRRNRLHVATSVARWRPPVYLQIGLVVYACSSPRMGRPEVSEPKRGARDVLFGRTSGASSSRASGGSTVHPSSSHLDQGAQLREQKLRSMTDAIRSRLRQSWCARRGHRERSRVDDYEQFLKVQTERRSAPSHLLPVRTPPRRAVAARQPPRGWRALQAEVQGRLQKAGIEYGHSHQSPRLCPRSPTHAAASAGDRRGSSILAPDRRRCREHVEMALDHSLRRTSSPSTRPQGDHGQQPPGL